MTRLWQWCQIKVLARWRSHLGTGAMVVAVLTAVGTWRTRDVPAGRAPDFTAEAVWGQAGKPTQQGSGIPTVSLAQWQAMHPGQPVAVHIWAEWCPYCKLEEAAVTRIAADWPVLTVASRSGNATQVARVMSQRQLPWVAAIDPAGTISATYGLSVVPAWVVLEPSGHISSVTTGYTTEWGMRARLWWAR